MLGFPQSFHFDRASPASGIPVNARPLATVVSNIFDLTILTAARVTVTLEASAVNVALSGRAPVGLVAVVDRRPACWQVSWRARASRERGPARDWTGARRGRGLERCLCAVPGIGCPR